ncbi:MAG: tripartite tricarboxylate transporter permease [Aminobacterium sp.]|jgi:putative tricarboxylic transport membrane protein|nr:MULTISPECIES: tripartite tricarboxylate transporter permease [unclassified Aminobacterium]MDD2207492.1 tripartite tricarboxylate transporter permease [Aminobacterium sp.]MDD3708260.1 tripartite tricarboxylate transporter permease [Aminobacterium sp.]MDD4229470.1 tripartite tricarboxylate transporter permease [Aminobacterium sp.]MDD4552341.1 tripartite tricarboxylate transporter permease [Aminobacterium sp.]MEA4878011.1 tripartite tricarboxylate transporter permease [Aminobacterium sp.]
MEHILSAFVEIFTPGVFLFLFIGVCIGLVVGSLPGLNDTITLAVLVPVTFSMDPSYAFMLLVGVYTSACYGGSIPAILLKIPGTASSVVTSLDGYQMTLKGKAGQALGISTTSSVFGGLVSSLVLMFLAPVLAKYALRFGPPEYFALAILGLSTVAGMSGKNVLKSLIVCAIGLLIATIGMSPQTGFPRFDFGNPYLLEGIPFVPMLIGLFGVTSVLEVAEEIGQRSKGNVSLDIPKIGKVLPDKKMVKRLLPTWLTSSAIGNVIGVIPGAGMLMAIYLAYDQAIRSNKDKEFGTGVPEGVAAPEAANNAVVASSMVPLMALGVPGNSTSALFLGALMIQGLRPGPSLFQDFPEVAYLIIVGFFVANILMGPLGIMLGKFLSGVIFKIPKEVLASVIAMLCITGAFAVGNSVFNIWVMLFFGILGFVFNKLKLPHSPLILAVILGAMMERGLYQSLVLSKGSYMIFLQRPISLVMLIVATLFAIAPILKKIKQMKSASIN